MNTEERNLDEALDEIDRWSEVMVREMDELPASQVNDYFLAAKAELERKLGRTLNLPVRSTTEKVS